MARPRGGHRPGASGRILATMTTDGDKPWIVLLTRALRGALAGLAAWGALVLAFDYADQAIREAEAANPVDNGVGILAATVGLGLRIGVPASAVTGFLVAWALRLRRPWAVALLGLLYGSVLLTLSCLLPGAESVPAWFIPAIIIVSYALAAATPLNVGRRQPANH